MHDDVFSTLTASGPVLVSNGFQSEYELGFANGLAGAGLRPILLASDSTLIHRLRPEVEAMNLRGSQDPRRPAWRKALNMLRYMFDLWRYLLRSRPRIVHVIGLFALPSPWAWLLEAFLLRCCCRRLVLTVHNLLPHDAHHALNHWRLRALYRVPHVLVVHTLLMKTNLIRDFGVDADRIVVMEHGFDRALPPSSGDVGWLRRSIGIEVRRPVVLFFGQIARYKGLDILIESFRRVAAQSDAVLVVAGPCRDQALRTELREAIKDLVDASRAVWRDAFVPEDEVLPYFHGSDVLAMPYRHIDQSGVMMMALATGLPVVASNVGSLGEYVPLTGGRLVPPGSVEALTEALLRQLALCNQVDRERIVTESARFAWSNTVLPLVAIYREAFK